MEVSHRILATLFFVIVAILGARQIYKLNEFRIAFGDKIRLSDIAYSLGIATILVFIIITIWR